MPQPPRSPELSRATLVPLSPSGGSTSRSSLPASPEPLPVAGPLALAEAAGRPPEVPPPPRSAKPLPTAYHGGEPFKLPRKVRTRRFVLVAVLGVGIVLGIVFVALGLFRGGQRVVSPPAVSPSAVPTIPFSERDSDNDGLTDEREVQGGTDLRQPDTDGDGYTDAQELEADFDPLGPGLLDRDTDGLPDRSEERIGSNPRTADTDGDGYLDNQEVQNCYNPTVPSPRDKIAACPPYPGL